MYELVEDFLPTAAGLLAVSLAIYLAIGPVITWMRVFVARQVNTARREVRGRENVH